eukprot:Gregarina_sp_Poly_1__573@NODE_1137_length_4975_cov_105_293602_g667_i2_p2_GENE_NODE_1137_length_4975_cov_105_293602_g667_i2NODE_1137_length_4975_cov_105_293602_g667_i2_p2_ORF_typecomplete_len289_score28_18Asp_Glu_race/PF01177_22/1_1e06AroM/PF07302_11/0_47AroM/PF07302_11/95_NODE_1137_length_4975_cov_105_293602_g667_i232054071
MSLLISRSLQRSLQRTLGLRPKTGKNNLLFCSLTLGPAPSKFRCTFLFMAYAIRSKDHNWEGIPIGVIVCETTYTKLPGNVANAKTFGFPVSYKDVKGLNAERMLSGDPTLLESFIETARQLEREGVRAITGACGFMIIFQPQVAAAVNIPVYLSSLLQVPFILKGLGPDQKLGVLTASKSSLTEAHWKNAGVSPSDMDSIAVAGMEKYDAFRSAIIEDEGPIDGVEAEICLQVDNLVAKYPQIAVLLLECSDMPPYADLIHKRTGLPVFDFTTMIRQVHDALEPHKY